MSPHPRLCELAGLSDGWYDGDGLAPGPHALTQAAGFLDLLPDHDIRVRVFPALDGSVLLEAHQDDRHWSLQISPGGQLEIILIDSPHDAAFTDPGTLRGAIDSFQAFAEGRS